MHHDFDPSDVTHTVDQLDARGYVVVENLLPDDQVSACRDLLTTLRTDAGSGHPPLVTAENEYMDPNYRAGRIYDLAQQYPRFRRIVEHESLTAVVDEAIGPGVVSFKNAVWYKPDEAFGPDDIQRSAEFLLVWVVLVSEERSIRPLRITGSGSYERNPSLSGGDVLFLRPDVSHLFAPEFSPDRPPYTYRLTFRELTVGLGQSGRDGPIAVTPVPPSEDVPGEGGDEQSLMRRVRRLIARRLSPSNDG